MTLLLTKEQLLAKRERRFREVQIPELEGAVRIRSLKSAEITAWQASLLDPKTGKPCIKRQKTGRERLVAISVVDEYGNPMLGKDDLETLNGLDNSVIGRIAAAATDFNGIEDDEDGEDALDDAVGNSKGTSDDSSPTD